MDLRVRVLRDCDAGMMAAAVAVKYQVSGSWVRLLKRRRRQTGEVASRTQRHGPPPKLARRLQELRVLIDAQPDRTLVELKEALGTDAGLATIWRAVTALGFTIKKTVHASEHDRPDVRLARDGPWRRRWTPTGSFFSMKVV
jgi:transposase